MRRKYIKQSVPERIIRAVIYIFMFLMCVICLAPILHVAACSFAEPKWLLQQSGLVLWPKYQTIKGYGIVFSSPSLMNSYLNTFFYVGTATTLGVLVTVMGAYVLSKREAVWSSPIMIMISFTMLFNGGMIPTYMVVRNLGLLDTRWAMIIPGCINAFNIIIMRTAMNTIPKELEESAKLDGAGPMRILFSIYLPLVKATIAVIILYYALGHWNSWFSAAIYLKSRKLYPLQLMLREILMQNDTKTITSTSDVAGDSDLYKELVQYCCIMVSTVPVLFFYPFVMKYFKSGVMVGSLKG